MSERGSPVEEMANFRRKQAEIDDVFDPHYPIPNSKPIGSIGVEFRNGQKTVYEFAVSNTANKLMIQDENGAIRNIVSIIDNSDGSKSLHVDQTIWKEFPEEELDKMFDLFLQEVPDEIIKKIKKETKSSTSDPRRQSGGERKRESSDEQKSEDEKTLECLTEVIDKFPKSQQDALVRKYRNLYHRYKDQTPIFTEDLPMNPLNYELSFSREVKERFADAVDEINEMKDRNREKREVGFVAYGFYDRNTGKISFEGSSDLIQGKQQSINYDDALNPQYRELEKRLKGKPDNIEGVLCVVHTHPPDIGIYADNFSLGDLHSVKDVNTQTKADTQGRRVRSISAMGIVITPGKSNLMFNSVMYDDESETGGFYRMPLSEI